MYDTMTRTEETPSTTPPARPRRWISAFLGLALFGAGAGIGWLVTSPDEAVLPTPPDPAEVVAESETDPALEPVAAVAEALLPSVVQIESSAGLGSGVIYDSQGLILTAAHVVMGADQVTVRLATGEQVGGVVLGGDLATDIAVVSVERSDLPAAPLALGDDPQVGQMAVAIGSPFGLDSTVTAGVVSALDQPVPGADGPRALLQTDAAINPGNSGGALANRDGEVIGINVSIFSTSGGNEGVGFAVPIDVAHDLGERIVAGEPVSTAVLGVTGTDVLSGAAGALITSVEPGSAAAEAGLAVGDLVVEIDGAAIGGIADLAAQVRSYRPGDELTLSIIRAGEPSELSATLG